MERFKVLRIRDGQLIELGDFDNEHDATDLADRAKYMAPIVLRCDHTQALTLQDVEQALGTRVRVTGRSALV
ncbi:MAG: hypothetical protein AB7O21_18445 [Gammaproteobacteria bacterium]